MAALFSGGLLFWQATRDSAAIRVDSGPYFSLAHNLIAHGKLVSNFNFVGNFDVLPSIPNFIAPGLGVFIAMLWPATGDLITAGRAVLFLSLVLTQWFASSILVRCTGSRGYAIATAGLLVWAPRTASLAIGILTELPFIACLLGGTLAAVVVLEDPWGARSRPLVKWLALPVASSLLCLTRYIGVFFPLTLSIMYGVQALGSRKPQRAQVLATAGYLIVYNVVAVGPIVLWLGAAWINGAPLVPNRPPSLLPLWRALWDAAVFLGAWAGGWVGAGLILLIGSRTTRSRLAEAHRRLDKPERLLGLAILVYVAVLIVVRTRSAYYPLRSLGTRYMIPAWPLVFILCAVLFHRFVWSLGDRWVRHLAVVGAVLLFVGQNLMVLAGPPVPLPFAMQTETYRTAIELLGEHDVVLGNYGQLLCHAKPEAHIISVPPELDFNYDLNLLPALVARHGVHWLIVFDQGDRLSFPELMAWLVNAPAHVHVGRTWRLSDGVIYELVAPLAARPGPARPPPDPRDRAPRLREQPADLPPPILPDHGHLSEG